MPFIAWKQEQRHRDRITSSLWLSNSNFQIGIVFQSHKDTTQKISHPHLEGKIIKVSTILEVVALWSDCMAFPAN